MKVGSLFSGIGGIDMGFKNSGFTISWANEIDEKAVQTYKANFHHPIIHDDIKNISSKSLPPIDVLVGGFPCQAFSIAGYRKGFADDRGSIVFELFKILESMSPNIVFLENVKNLLSHQNGNTLKYLLQCMSKLGYKVKYKVLNTCEYSDIPQNRERIYIIGFLNHNDYNKFQFPAQHPNKKGIENILETNVPDIFYYKHFNFYPVLKSQITKYDTFYQWRRGYVRENKNKLCPTLTANMGTGGHNVPLIKDCKGIRKLTPRECARLQGFEDGFVLPKIAKSHLYKQIGNSVSVPVIEKIAYQIKLATSV
ncbi:MAG: modification methylase Bsp6I [Candidatus Xenolissoclinum pacificiensis L6]|uniref:Cytosine-specific methyltransferase n=1 Tax=Candidatus Xenolissoclinum pacificiensis L6 TaxID=1401685 RepID=W2UZY9_9RICK|nr:MAG: modification methylase Bsp6I [Candidatus Xenolissoclinum pacificiensis L6]